MMICLFFYVQIYFLNLKIFKSKDQSFQRAHGDNIKISSQSPEAFEEFFWKKELNDKYIGKNFLEKMRYHK